MNRKIAVNSLLEIKLDKICHEIKKFRFMRRHYLHLIVTYCDTTKNISSMERRW